jgi:hypothetical protein
MKGANEERPRPGQSVLRFGRRAPLALPVTLNAEGQQPARGTIRNASISGAFIETALELPVHTNVAVTLAMPQPAPETNHILNACVVRVDATGLGIEWRDMASVDVLVLLRQATASA